MKKNSRRLRVVVAVVIAVLSVVLFKYNNDAAQAAETYTVTFVNGSATVSTTTVERGQTIKDIPEVAFDGFIFAGWYTSNHGSIVDINAANYTAYDFNTGVTSDTTLYAGWLEVGVGASADFYLEGVQYRDASDGTSGIRFITRINLGLEDDLKKLSSLNANIRPKSTSDKGLGYGTVVTMKSNIPAGGMLVKDEEAKYVKTGMVVSPAVNTYKYENDSRYYTAVILGISEKYYDTDMAARPYITYYDANGIIQTYYCTEQGNVTNTLGGAYFTTYNKVKNAYAGGDEPSTEEPTTEEPTTEEPTTEIVEYGDPDVVVTDIIMSPANPEEGDSVVFSAVVKNQGTASTPAGVITGVKFTVAGNPSYMWSDTYTSSIKPGQTVLLTANGGVNGKSWNASSIGSYSVTAHVDDVNRYKEGNENNNTYTKSYSVVEKSEIDYVTDPSTGATCLDGFGEYTFAGLYNAGLVTTTGGRLSVSSKGTVNNSADSSSLVYTYEIKENMYFSETVDKMILDLTVADPSTVVNVYAGNSTTPILSVTESADNITTFEGGAMFDLSEAGLKGSQKIKIEVVLSRNASGTDFELNDFRFMYATIPTVYINIDESLGTINAMNSSLDKTAECYGNILVTSPEGYICEYTGTTLKDLTLDLEYIRGRGNSTWEAPKKPYKVKLDSKADLFGMGKNKHWCLLANYYDKSFMRNKLAYTLGDSIGMPYTVKSVFVDVVMNGEHLGSYLLSEQVRVDDNRVEIDDLEDTPDATDEATISGGYLIEITPYERVKPDEVYFGASKVHKAMVFESPSFEDGINQAQYNYIQNYFHRMEEAVYSSNGYNSQGEYWTDLLDLDSAVNFYLMQEIFKNNDAMYASARFYKPRGEKLHMGPIWDFDLTAGTYACNNTENPEGWFVKNEYLFSALMRHSEFKNAVKTRYWEIRDDVLALYTDTNESESYINQYYDVLEYTYKLNFDKWGYGNNGWENILCQGDWDDEVTYLRNWFQRRINWMDANINGI